MVRRTAILVVLVALGACSQGRKLDNARGDRQQLRLHALPRRRGQRYRRASRQHARRDRHDGPGRRRPLGARRGRRGRGRVPVHDLPPRPRSGSTAHGNGQVDVSLRRGRGLGARGGRPAFDPGRAPAAPSTATARSRAGGGNAPRGRTSGNGAGACGTCHGVPPPSPHLGRRAPDPLPHLPLRVHRRDRQRPRGRRGRQAPRRPDPVLRPRRELDEPGERRVPRVRREREPPLLRRVPRGGSLRRTGRDRLRQLPRRRLAGWRRELER